MIKVTKVSSKEGRPANIRDDYWVIGEAENPPEVGKSFFMWRYENPTGAKLGYFRTSEVVSVEGNTFSTLNSVYRIENL